MSRPLFKNKKYVEIEQGEKSDNFSFDDIYIECDNDDENLYNSLKVPEIPQYDESSDSDLSVLDSIINRGKTSSKERDRDNKKRRKKEEKDKKKKAKKERRIYKKQEESMIDLEDLYDDMEIRKYREEKESENFYSARFNGSMVLIRELMKQVNSELVNNKSIQDKLKVNRARGSLNALTTQSANINSLLGTKLNIVKEIHSLNKTISDLELKRNKDMLAANAASGGDVANNEDYIMNEILGKIVNGEVDIDNMKDVDGVIDSSKKKKKKKKKMSEDDEVFNSVNNYKRNKGDCEEEIDPFADEMNEGDNIANAGDVVYEGDGEELDEHFNNATDIDYADYGDDIDSALDARIDELIDEGELSFSDTEKAYMYEGSVKIIVVKNADSERWRFMAIDDDGDEIFDYPLPTKRAVGTPTFDRELGVMKDKLGNVYPLEYERTEERIR